MLKFFKIIFKSLQSSLNDLFANENDDDDDHHHNDEDENIDDDDDCVEILASKSLNSAASSTILEESVKYTKYSANECFKFSVSQNSPVVNFK